MTAKELKWHFRYLELARHISLWSKDISTKVGAVIVNSKNHVVSLGYNGAPAGVKEPDQDNREQRLARTIHAEENALMFARQDVTGATLYCTHFPCSHCAALIIQSGIKTVVIKSAPENLAYQDRWIKSISESNQMFREAGVAIYRFSIIGENNT